MTREERNCYSRGYSAGMNRKYPVHKPPIPPNSVLAEFLEAGTALADCAHGFISMLEKDDDWSKEMRPGIERFDAALYKFRDWLTAKPGANHEQ